MKERTEGFFSVDQVTPPSPIDHFVLHLADGSKAEIPCTPIDPFTGDAVLAASIHHLICRVDTLSAEVEQLRNNLSGQGE